MLGQDSTSRKGDTLTERFVHLYESVGRRDLIEIAILSAFIYGVLRFIGATRGTSMVRGLGIVVVGFILLVQVIIASFDLTELSKTLDYLLTAVLCSLIVIFQPELRRGLLMLGRYRMFRVFGARRADCRPPGRGLRGPVGRVHRGLDRPAAQHQPGSLRQDRRTARQRSDGWAVAGYLPEAQPLA